jgi:hypothetical protein
MEQQSKPTATEKLEQEPRTYRIVLRRDFHEETDDPFVEDEGEPETNDIMFEGTVAADGVDLWEEAGLTDPIEEDKYELQAKDEDDSWKFVGFFSSNEDLQWVLERSADASADVKSPAA